MLQIEVSRRDLVALNKFIHEAVDRVSIQSLFKDDDVGTDSVMYLIQRLSALEHTPVYVNAYAVTREYGGPEEGGWYYNTGELIESIQTTTEEAPSVKTVLEAKHAEVSEGDIYSVLGGVELHVNIEDEPGADWPSERPHYE